LTQSSFWNSSGLSSTGQMDRNSSEVVGPVLPRQPCGTVMPNIDEIIRLFAA
jgi:hypothetical protein